MCLEKGLKVKNKQPFIPENEPFNKTEMIQLINAFHKKRVSREMSRQEIEDLLFGRSTTFKKDPLEFIRNYVDKHVKQFGKGVALQLRKKCRSPCINHYPDCTDGEVLECYKLLKNITKLK